MWHLTVDSLVVKVHLSGVLIKHHILQHCAKLDGIPNLRLILPLQVDALGIAAPLNVEDTIEAPAVFVIANQWSGRVCGQCGLASACRHDAPSAQLKPIVKHKLAAWCVLVVTSKRYHPLLDA